VYGALLALEKFVDEAIASALNRWGDLKKASKYGFQKYGDLLKLNLPGLQGHHLIEKRLAGPMGEIQDDMISIVVTPEEHQAFTNAWRTEVPYVNSTSPLPNTSNVVKGDVIKAALRIYKDYPAIIEQISVIYPGYC
jgi:hypothetical protein